MSFKNTGGTLAFSCLISIFEVLLQPTHKLRWKMKNVLGSPTRSNAFQCAHSFPRLAQGVSVTLKVHSKV